MQLVPKDSPKTWQRFAKDVLRQSFLRRPEPITSVDIPAHHNRFFTKRRAMNYRFRLCRPPGLRMASIDIHHQHPYHYPLHPLSLSLICKSLNELTGAIELELDEMSSFQLLSWLLLMKLFINFNSFFFFNELLVKTSITSFLY